MAEGNKNALTLAPELMARVRQIQIRTHRLVSSVLQGAYRSNFRGTGIEFEEVRPYQPGDEVRSIDWNVTARTGEPHIKTYIEDRQLTLQLLVDTSRSMDFGSRERTKREAAAALCALLSYVAMSQQDQVGLCLYAAEPGLHLSPDKGQHHVLRVVREVMAAEASGYGSSLVAVLDHQLRHLKQRTLIVVLSDFLDRREEDWERMLGRASRRHDVLCIRLFDPLEEELPRAGIITLRDVESGRVTEIDTGSSAIRERWAEDARQRRASLLASLSRAHVDLAEVSTVGDVAEPIVKAFHRRARGRRMGGIR